MTEPALEEVPAAVEVHTSWGVTREQAMDEHAMGDIFAALRRTVVQAAHDHGHLPIGDALVSITEMPEGSRWPLRLTVSIRTVPAEA